MRAWAACESPARGRQLGFHASALVERRDELRLRGGGLRSSLLAGEHHSACSARASSERARVELGAFGGQRCGQRRARNALAVELLLERRAGDRLGAVGGLRCGEHRAGAVALGDRAGVRAALGGERRVELGETALELRSALGGVPAHARQRARARESAPRRSPRARPAARARTAAASAAARCCPSATCSAACSRAASASAAPASAAASACASSARLARQLLLEPPDAALLLAQARERHGIRRPQQLAPAQPPALLAELALQPLDGRDRSRERLRPRVRRGAPARRLRATAPAAAAARRRVPPHRPASSGRSAWSASSRRSSSALRSSSTSTALSASAARSA